jgi:hypothetical protein
MKSDQTEVDRITGIADQSWFSQQSRRIFGVSLSEEDQARVDQLQSQLTSLREERSEALLKTVNWKMIWGIPAVGAAVIMLLFALFFRDDLANTAITEGDVAEAAAREEHP